MIRCIQFFLFLSILCPTVSFATDETIHKMDEIVVTSTQKTKAIDTPASLSIITGKELEEMGAKNIVEALSKIPGVVDSSTKSRSVVIRGNKSSMAGGPVILIDGVPQKMGDYRYSEFNFIPVNQIERIEILRSAGISYGPGAARGVINIITKKSQAKGVHGDASFSYGSWDSHEENASISNTKNKYDYQLNAGNYHTDGYENEKENRLSILGQLGYNMSSGSRIGLRVNHIDYDHNTAEGFSKGQWQLENYRRESHFPKSETNSDWVWHNEKNQENTTTAIEFSHKDEKTFIDSSLSWTHYDEKFKRLKDQYVKPSAVYHENSGQDTYALTLSGGHHFVLGAANYTPSFGFSCEYIDNTVDRNYPNDPAKNTDKYNFNLDEKLYGIFWDNDFYFFEKYGLNIGVRMDRAEVSLKDKVPTIVDETRDMFSYFVAPSYHFNEKSTIYASLARNYWFPTPRYYAWAVEKGETINPAENLEPEEVITYELGYKHMLKKAVNINATLYFSDYKDKFGSVYEGSSSRGQGNIGDAEAKGIELEADGKIRDLFGYRLAAAYQNIEWTSGTASVYTHPDNTRVRDADISGKQIYWMPKFSGLAGLSIYPVGKLKISLDMNYQGKRYVDYLNRIEYPAKATFDARIGYTFKQWKFWILGKNIFDEPLEYVSNASGRLTDTDGEPLNYYYVQNGVYVEAGINYRF